MNTEALLIFCKIISWIVLVICSMFSLASIAVVAHHNASPLKEDNEAIDYYCNYYRDMIKKKQR